MQKRGVFGAVLLIFLFCTAVSMGGCTSLFYQPSRLEFSDPMDFGFQPTDVSLQASDGTPLHGWYFSAKDKKTRGTMIFFHGNAQNISSHFPSALWITRHGYDLYLFDYRGYGRSHGVPNQKGVNDDAVSAIRYVMEHSTPPKGVQRDLVLFGQSLGGAISMRAFGDIQKRDRFRAVIVDSTFYSYRTVARRVAASSWVTWIFQPLAWILVSNEYGPGEAIAGFAPIPFLVIHGLSDEVVSIENGEDVFEAAQEPKTFWRVPNAGHIESLFVEEGAYRKKLVEYLDRVWTAREG